nr:XIAP-associated factor 1 [Odocoileus virginianus texanus]
MEEAYQVCRNCKRRVASNLLALHEAHCLVFLVLCPECKEHVLWDKMEEHRQGGHQQVGCATCQQSMPKDLLESHKLSLLSQAGLELAYHSNTGLPAPRHWSEGTARVRDSSCSPCKEKPLSHNPLPPPTL